MSVSAVKGIRWTAIAIAFAMVMAAASPAFDRNESLAWFLGACALIVVMLLWYRRVMPQAEAREEEHQAQQLLALRQQLSLTGEPVSVTASSGLVVLVFCVCLLVLSGLHAFTHPTSTDLIVVFAALAVVTAVLALLIVPRVGMPALTIRPDGLALPVYGFVRWDEIDSIGLQSFTTKGVTTHSIDIYVPNLKERERTLHPLLRVTRPVLRRRSPNFIVVHLVSPSLPATLVHALCYDIWKERTGKARVWTSMLSEQQIEQWRRTDERFEMLKRAGAESDPAKALQLLDDIDKEFGRPSIKQKANKEHSPAEIARHEALFADLRRSGPRDPASTRRLLEKHVNASARNRGVTLAIIGVVLAAVVVAALALFGH